MTICSSRRESRRSDKKISSTVKESGASEADTKSCFVISPIGSEGSESRLRADKLLKFVICEVLEPKGYIVHRADTLSEPGVITNQIVQKIVDCDLLVADLSEHNPNVFYELALRHGLKKPFIHMIDENYKIPFDNAGMRAIIYDLTDLYSVERAKDELSAQVDAIESDNFSVESPITIAFDLESLKNSGRSDEAILVQIVEEISSIKRDLLSNNSVKISQSRPTAPPRKKFELPSSVEVLIDNLRENRYPNTSSQFIKNFSVAEWNPPILKLKKSSDFKDQNSFNSRFMGALKASYSTAWQVTIEE